MITRLRIFSLPDSKEKRRMVKWAGNITNCNKRTVSRAQAKLQSFGISSMKIDEAISDIVEVENVRVFELAEKENYNVDSIYKSLLLSLFISFAESKLHIDKLKSTCKHWKHVGLYASPKNFTEPYPYYVLSWYYDKIVSEKKGNKNLLNVIFEKFKSNTTSLINVLAVLKLEVAKAYDITFICDHFVYAYDGIKRFHLISEYTCLTTGKSVCEET